VKTFPIKKRTNNELFIDGKQGLYTQIKRRVRIRMSDLSEEGEPKQRDIICGMKIQEPVWNDLHFMEGKTNKRQPIWKDWTFKREKYCRVKWGFLSVYYDILQRRQQNWKFKDFVVEYTQSFLLVLIILVFYPNIFYNIWLANRIHKKSDFNCQQWVPQPIIQRWSNPDYWNRNTACNPGHQLILILIF